MAIEQPTGTVTLVFTDIEGSTRLLEQLGVEAYREALAEHRRIVRDACARHSGYEVDAEGDAFFYAFATAQAAVTAVSEAMFGLDGGPIRIRVGIHTGEPALEPPNYLGLDVHRAARIMAAAHGGQVVLSPTTVSQLEPEAFDLHDLGEHRFKDLEAAIPIFQLAAGSFPPLKTISNTNLPRPASSFVGRQSELADVLARIDGGARLVTLTGPGGTGKTRLALEAAATLVPTYKAGVFWVGLATLRDPALVSETIAHTLGAKDGLADHIAERQLLLLLDNLEQVIEVAPELSSLLQACPNLTLLVTSRELLRVQGEVEYPVPPLDEPEAVSLFCERAQTEPTDEISKLCLRLDHLPLAVELAAARGKALSPAQILQRVSSRLDLLKGGRDADPRQQTLRATIEWSHDLLTDNEQQLFARLAVFAGGCTLEAAEEVADADLDILQSLVEKSLLRSTNERYWMLETIRDLGVERLSASSEGEEIRARHAARHRQLAVELMTPLRQYSAGALATIEQEQDNMRAALGFALDRDEVGVASDLMAGLWFYWLSAGRGAEARSWAVRYLASSRARAHPLERFHGDLGAGQILRFAGDAEAGAALDRELVATARAHPHAVVHGIVIERSLAALLSDLTYTELEAGRIVEAQALAEEALAIRRELGLPHGVAHALFAVAAVAFHARDLDHARNTYAEAATIYETEGSHGDALGAQLSVAECELELGRFDESAALLQDAMRRLHEFSDVTMNVQALRVAARLAASRGDAERSAALLGATDSRLEQSGLTLFSPFEEELHQTCLRRARDELGEARFTASYENGAEASDEAAFALAMTVE